MGTTQTIATAIGYVHNSLTSRSCGRPRTMKPFRTVLVKPESPPEVVELQHRRSVFTELLGGDLSIRAVARTTRGGIVQIISCESAAAKGLPYNRCGVHGLFFFAVQRHDGSRRELSIDETRKAMAWVERHSGDPPPESISLEEMRNREAMGRRIAAAKQARRDADVEWATL